MRKVTVLLLFAIWQSPTIAQIAVRGTFAIQDEEFSSGEKFALLAGVSRYPSASSLRQLNWATRDIRRIGKTLESLGYTVNVLEDHNATRVGIRKAIAALEDAVIEKNATIIFYFSGHGFAVKNGVQSENFLATFDASYDNLKKTGISLDEIRLKLRKIGVKRQLLIIDACRNDPAAAGSKNIERRAFSDFEQAEGEQILFSTRFGDYSYETAELRNGVFSYYVNEGLSGSARGADGYLSVNDLFNFVRQRVSRWAFEHNSRQRPFRGGEVSGDFLIHGQCAGSDCLLETANTE